jgi:hypothetical protein
MVPGCRRRGAARGGRSRRRQERAGADGVRSLQRRRRQLSGRSRGGSVRRRWRYQRRRRWRLGASRRRRLLRPCAASREDARKREGGGRSRFHPNPTGLGVFCWAFPCQNRPTEQLTSVLSCRIRARILHSETDPNTRQYTCSERGLEENSSDKSATPCVF